LYGWIQGGEEPLVASWWLGKARSLPFFLQGLVNDVSAAFSVERNTIKMADYYVVSSLYDLNHEHLRIQSAYVFIGICPEISRKSKRVDDIGTPPAQTL
jgi:hypothetical protein